MYFPQSTRAKSNNPDKLHNSIKFFKKLSTDQNQRNFLNFPDKLLKGSQSTKNILTTYNQQSKLKSFSKIKKPSQVLTLSKSNSKSNITLPQQDLTQISSTKLTKIPSYKNLKLLTSISSQLPLLKCGSQTTLNKKIDENKLKMMMNKSKSIIKGPKQTNINNFRLGKKLGSGRFGNVYFVQQKYTGMIFALKVMAKSKIKQADMFDQVFWQIKLGLYLRHPNIVKLYGVFDDAKNIYLIMQYCSLCLFKQVRNRQKLPQQQSACLGKQMIASLKYLHNENIIHRDIKPQNIMLNYGVAKLSDFGWSTYAPLYKRQTFCGTADYVPPQIVSGVHYDERVDVWALGVLLFQLSSGYAPFQTKNQNLTYDKILHSQCKYPSFFSKNLIYLLDAILNKNPEKRPNLDQIENCEWFEKYKSVGRYISKQIWTYWSTFI